MQELQNRIAEAWKANDIKLWNNLRAELEAQMIGYVAGKQCIYNVN